MVLLLYEKCMIGYDTKQESFLPSCKLIIWFQGFFKVYFFLSFYQNKHFFYLRCHLSFSVSPLACIFVFCPLFFIYRSSLPLSLCLPSWHTFPSPFWSSGYDSVNTSLIILPFQKSDFQLASGLKYHQYLIKWLSFQNTTQIGKGKKLKKLAPVHG